MKREKDITHKMPTVIGISETPHLIGQIRVVGVDQWGTRTDVTNDCVWVNLAVKLVRTLDRTKPLNFDTLHENIIERQYADVRVLEVQP